MSPEDKGQGDIVGDGLTTVASRSGDAVAFSSRTPFGDTVGSGVSGQTQFVAQRGAGGWAAHAITPTPRPDAYQTFFAQTRIQTFSDDLRTAIVWAYDLPGVTGGAPFRNSIYVEDAATRSLEPVTVSQQDPLVVPDFIGFPLVWGISANARHVAFVSTTQMLPEAASGGVPNVYKWDDGVLSLAGVLPDGTVPVGGSDVVPFNFRGAMSADGTRQLFSASTGGNTQLYMRIDGSRRSTAWVSQPEGTDQSDPVNVLLQATTPDGRNVFFVSDSRLLDDDTNFGPDVYRYTDSPNPAGDANLTLISNNGDVPGDNNGGGVVGASDDGQRVYYETNDSLMVWDHGVTRLVSDSVARPGDQSVQLSAIASRPGYARVTPDGMYMAFLSNSTLNFQDGVHGLTGQVTNAHFEMYLYSLRDGTLTCVSCPSGAASVDATVRPGATSGDPAIDNEAFRSHFLSDNGQVFFNTAEKLVPEDNNGAVDAYEFDPATGTLSLLSSGRGRDASTFADASASGDDVFLVTRQRLAADDRDNLVDLYDARTGPPLPVQPTTEAPPCDDDTCQPPLSSSPADDALGSAFLDESGAGIFRPKTFAVRQHIVLRGPAGSLRVRVSGSGSVHWGGRGLRGGSIRRGRGGTYELRLRLDRHARTQLHASGTYTTLVHLTFRATGGDQIRRTTRVTFRAVAKKGR